MSTSTSRQFSELKDNYKKAYNSLVDESIQMRFAQVKSAEDLLANELKEHISQECVKILAELLRDQTFARQDFLVRAYRNILETVLLQLKVSVNMVNADLRKEINNACRYIETAKNSIENVD